MNMPAANKSSGQNMSMPDICNVPAAPSPIPTPFVNMGALGMAMPPAITVKYGGVNALNMGSQIPTTTGDEPGSAGPIKGPGAFNMGNPTVIVEGQPAEHAMMPTRGNNAPIGVQSVPCVNMVLITRLPDAVGPAPGTYARDYAMDTAGVVSLLDDIGLAPQVERRARISVSRNAAGAPRIRVRTFHAGIARTLAAVFPSLEAFEVDLRGNRGGLYAEALAVTELLLEAAERARITVLVDGSTASAAEVVAHALQSQGAARIVGEPTAGKLSLHAVALAPATTQPLVAAYLGEVAPITRVEPDATP